MSNHPKCVAGELAGMRFRVASMTEMLWAARDGGELMDVVVEVRR